MCVAGCHAVVGEAQRHVVGAERPVHVVCGGAAGHGHGHIDAVGMLAPQERWVVVKNVVVLLVLWGSGAVAHTMCVRTAAPSPASVLVNCFSLST